MTEQTKLKKIKSAAIMLGISATVPVLIISGAIALKNIVDICDKPKRERQSQLIASLTNAPVSIDAEHYQASFYKDGTNYVFNYAGKTTNRKN